MGKALRRAEPAKICGLENEIVPIMESTLSNPATNFATDIRQHHEISATRALGQEQIHRTGDNWRPAIGVEPEITLCNTFSHLRA